MAYKYHREVADQPAAYRIAYATLANLGRLTDYPFVANQLDIEGYRLRGKEVFPDIDRLVKFVEMARA